jgi:hypothetical protein
MEDITQTQYINIIDTISIYTNPHSHISDQRNNSLKKQSKLDLI